MDNIVCVIFSGLEPVHASPMGTGGHKAQMRLKIAGGATCCGSKGNGRAGLTQGLPNALRQRL